MDAICNNDSMNAGIPDELIYHNSWCPYCDKIVTWKAIIYFDLFICMSCKREFPPNTFPKGLNSKTGELETAQYK